MSLFFAVLITAFFAISIASSDKQTEQKKETTIGQQKHYKDFPNEDKFRRR